MKRFKPSKFLAPALAFFAAALFCACDSDGNFNPWSMPDDPHYASEMTQTQTATASTTSITVAPTTKTLVLGGASGKTIYMARTNATDKALAGANTRIARIGGSVSESAAKSLENLSASIEADFVSGLEFDGANDPHKKIYDTFLKELDAAKGAAASKRAASPIQASAANHSAGDTEEFWELNPKDLKTFNKKTFKLLVSETNYNVWVDTEDKYYRKSGFENAAIQLGKNFINGYGLVSHLYGEPADKLYNEDGSEYGDMESKSKTGLKINIMLYDMLEEGNVYGFVYHGDVYHNIGGSNEGRFVYIDSQTTLNKPLEAYSTAQHEFSHTISKNQKAILHGREWTYWYGELLAMMCEDMMQNYLGIDDSEVDENMACTPKARLPQANALAWRNGISGEDSLAYASVFQFGAWLSRNFGGARFIKELAQNAYVDMESVLRAVNAMGGAQYTQATLLQKFAGDLLVEESGKGFNQPAETYPTSPEYTCSYIDEAGQEKNYIYPITPINLWDYFYAWCDTSNNADNYSNKSVSFSSLPAANMYKKANWTEKGLPVPTSAYLGPAMFKSGTIYSGIGPYGSSVCELGTVNSDRVEINFQCVGGYCFGDTVTIYVK